MARGFQLLVFVSVLTVTLFSLNSSATNCGTEYLEGTTPAPAGAFSEYHPNRFSVYREHKEVKWVLSQMTDDTLLVIGTDGKFAEYNYRTQAFVRKMQIEKGIYTNHVKISNDNSVGIIAGEYAIQILDLKAGVVKKTIQYAANRPQREGHGNVGYEVMYITQDNKRAFLNGANADFLVLDLENGTILFNNDHARLEIGIDYRESPDHRYVSATTIQARQFLYDLQENRLIQMNEGPSQPLTVSGDFSLDSKTFYTLSNYQQIIAYDIATKTMKPTDISLQSAGVVAYWDKSTDGNIFMIPNYIDPTRQGPQKPFTLLKRQDLSVISFDLPQRKYDDYIAYHVETRHNVITASTIRRNFWIFDIQSQVVTEYMLPDQWGSNLGGLITWDGKSVFPMQMGAPGPFVFEAASP